MDLINPLEKNTSICASLTRSLSHKKTNQQNVESTFASLHFSIAHAFTWSELEVENKIFTNVSENFNFILWFSVYLNFPKYPNKII
jgi:hypothetical protein